MLPELEEWVPVALDTETSGLYADDGARVSVVSLAWVDPEILRGDLAGLARAVKTGEGVHSVALPFSQGVWCGANYGHKPGSQLDLFTLDEDNPNLGRSDWECLIGWLRGRRLVFHHGKFDCEKMRYPPIGWPAAHGLGGIDLLDEWYWDTQIAAREIWPDHATGLKPTAGRLWGHDATAEAQALKAYLGKASSPRYDLVPWPVMRPYAAKDAELTIRLFYAELARVGLVGADSGEWFAAVNRTLLDQCRKQIEVAKSLYRMERAGIPYDAAGSHQAAQVLLDRRDQIDRGLPFKATGAQARRWFFTSQTVRGPDNRTRRGIGLAPIETTKTGAPAFTEKVVTRITQMYPETDEVGRVARRWQERQKLHTAINMWYLPYAAGIGPDGRLRTTFRQVSRGRGDVDGGTRSGRFSVERVNLQAIPHDYRLSAGPERNWPVPTPRQLIGQAAARLEGWELWEFDLAQAELRLAAAWARCERMLSAFREGRDLHSETTTELFGYTPNDPEWKMYRQIGKRANFTLCFGAGGATLAYMVQKETGLTMTDDEGARIVDRWNGIYPEFRRAIDRWSQYATAEFNVPLASAAGFGTGRLRRFDRAEVRIGLHKAFNQLVQGSLGEFAKDWNLTTQRICDDLGLGWVDGVGWTGLVLVIHDSQVLLLPADRAAEIARVLEDEARALWSQFFDRPDPRGRVACVEGYSEGKRW